MLDLEQELFNEIATAEDEFAQVAQEEFDAIIASEAWEYL